MFENTKKVVDLVYYATILNIRVVHGYAQLVGQAPQTVYEMQRGIFLKNVKQKSP